MRAVWSLLQLEGADRRLLLRAVLSLAVVRLSLSLRPLSEIRGRVADKRKPGLPVDRMVWAVSTAARRMPGATCLVSACTLQRLLAREGYESELHIGVAKRDSKFAAHAWVTREGRTLIGEEESADYTRLLAWSSELPGKS